MHGGNNVESELDDKNCAFLGGGDGWFIWEDDFSGAGCLGLGMNNRSRMLFYRKDP